MGNMRELPERHATDPLGRRIRRNKRRIGRLQFKQLLEQLVVLGIRDGRRVNHVIAVAMRLDVAPKRLSALARLLRDHHQEKSRSASAPPGAMPRASMLPCTA